MAIEVLFVFSGLLQLEKIEDSVEFISSRPKALAIYAFTKNQTLQRRMVSETSSGSLVFNDAILQVLICCLSLSLSYLIKAFFETSH